MHELIGTWRLVEWTFTVNDSRPTHPWGGDPVGLLTYGSDGRMSASLMSIGRPSAPTRTLSAAPIDIRAAAAAGYLSYAGAYTVEGDDVLHHIELSLMPNWVGTTERRHIEWTATGTGRDLILSTPPTRTDGGRTAVNRLRWEKTPAGVQSDEHRMPPSRPNDG
ncbi:MAG: lipocalin-like domain-containing protein [Acidimicrobiia bacterium]